jgi:hypothetical protein
MFAFIHIEKAAGTTLIHLLRKNIFPRYLDARPLTRTVIAKNGLPVVSSVDLRMYKRLNPFIQCIGGHAVVPFSDLESEEHSVKYFSVVREPIDRYLSHYFYRVHKLGVNDSFDAYLDIEMLHNLQSKKFGNSGDCDDALKVILSKKIFIGFADDFDDFLESLKERAFPLIHNTAYSRINVGGVTRYNDLREKYYHKIIEANEQDILLYNKLKDIFPYSHVSNSGGGVKDNDGRKVGIGDRLIGISDYFIRKAYYEPITGLIRKLNGLSYYGSQK